MRITTKGEYGIRALLELAQRYGEGPVPSAEIAAAQHVPENYLDQILLLLRRAGIVRSIRGPSGGHMLARAPEEINLGEVLSVLEGTFEPMECVNPDFSDCLLLESCTIRRVWRELKHVTDEVLYSTTLAHLVEQSQPRIEQPVYFI